MLDQLAPRSRRNAPRLERTMLDDFNRRACERTTPLLRCCRGLARGLLRTLPALAAHLVGIPAVVTHHLKALIRNVLRDRRDEIACREYLKVALDLRVHSRAIENRITRTIHLHLRHGERIANNVLLDRAIAWIPQSNSNRSTGTPYLRRLVLAEIFTKASDIIEKRLIDLHVSIGSMRNLCAVF